MMAETTTLSANGTVTFTAVPVVIPNPNTGSTPVTIPQATPAPSGTTVITPAPVAAPAPQATLAAVRAGTGAARLTLGKSGPARAASGATVRFGRGPARRHRLTHPGGGLGRR